MDNSNLNRIIKVNIIISLIIKNDNIEMIFSYFCMLSLFISYLETSWFCYRYYSQKIYIFRLTEYDIFTF